MPRGYRCIFVAFVGWLSLTAANPPAENKQQAVTANQTSPAPPPYAPYAKLSENACYYSKGHDAADLCAQWRAAIAAEKSARAAEAAADWSKIATILSGLALIALLLTVSQTQRGLAHARIGNLISEQTARRQLRAYVSHVRFEMEFKRDDLGNALSCNVASHWTNAGQTPANRTRAWINFDFFPGDLPTDFAFAAPPNHPAFGNLAVGPGQTFKSVSLPISMTEFQSVAQGQSSLYVWSYANYSDGFVDDRNTKVASQVKIATSPSGEYRIVFNAIEHHNTMDDDSPEKPNAVTPAKLRRFYQSLKIALEKWLRPSHHA